MVTNAKQDPLFAVVDKQRPVISEADHLQLLSRKINIQHQLSSYVGVAG
jgi:hypothetical protein